MTRYLKYFALAFVVLAILVPVASARPFVVVGGGWGWGPGWNWAPAYYGWYGPAWGGYVYEAPHPDPNTGKVKIETKMRDARVYVDGGYAGTVGELKTFALHIGAHDIELRDSTGQTIFEQNVSVIAGKTIRVNA